jgi:hypothetical protein
MLGSLVRVMTAGATAALFMRREAEKAGAASTVQFAASNRGNVAIDLQGRNGADALAASSDSGTAITASGDIGDAIAASSSTGIAVRASSGGGAAVYAYGGQPQEPDAPGGENQVTDGIHAVGGGYPKSAVRAQGRSGYALFATSSGGGTCVYAEARYGTGLEARSTTRNAILATSHGEMETVRADNRGIGPGIVAKSAFAVGVTGVSAHAPGIHGKSSGSGVAAVYGENTDGGYGGVFEGTRAPLRLVPQFSPTGFPASGLHASGELFVDTAGNLWFCAAGGSPGRWRQIVLR